MKNKLRALCLSLSVVAALVSVLSPVSTAQRVRASKPTPVRESARTSPVVVVKEDLTAASLGGARLPCKVLLPANYAAGARRYPVLYLLHGAYGDENDWTTRSNLAAYVERYHLIVVMPGVGDSWYANSAGDARARYEDAIVRDLIPHIDAKYRTLSSWHGRAVAGLSMGGFGAVKFALRYPQLFAFAASFSGAFDAPRTSVVASSASEAHTQLLLRIFGAAESETRRRNDVFELLRATNEGARLPYLYVSTGASDPLKSVMPSNPRFADALRERRVAYEYHERPGAHDWRFWDTEIRLALERMSEFVAHMQP